MFPKSGIKRYTSMCGLCYNNYTQVIFIIGGLAGMMMVILESVRCLTHLQSKVASNGWSKYRTKISKMFYNKGKNIHSSMPFLERVKILRGTGSCLIMLINGRPCKSYLVDYQFSKRWKLNNTVYNACQHLPLPQK